MSSLGFNKACGIEDFANPELVTFLRDACEHKRHHFSADFPKGAEHRKDWEVAMAVRTLRELGAMRPDSTLLGVAAGMEDTVFYLTRFVRQVFATDRYFSSGAWEEVAPVTMLVEPDVAAPFDFELNRLVVQHMDGRVLRYPPDTFDGIFSSGSIEHFGGLHDVANAAYEMGRVLKPGGVLTLSTELRLSGPHGGIGWPGATLLLSPENLRRYIIEASGLELVDEFDTSVSPETLATPRDLMLAIEDHRARVARSELGSRAEFVHWDFPHLVLVHDGYAFTSVHLALRKTGNHPIVPNEWAAPSDELKDSIRAGNLALLGSAEGWCGEEMAETAPGTSGDTRPQSEPAAASPCHLVREVERQGATVHASLTVLADELGHLDEGSRWAEAASAEVDDGIGRIAAARSQLGHLLSKGGTNEAEPHPGRTSTNVTIGDVRFEIVVDAAATDPVTLELRLGRSLDHTLVALMLELLPHSGRMLDLGAHVGTFSLAAAAAGAWTLAVEASPENVALLQASAARNGFPHLLAVHAAVSDEPGELEFLSHGPWGRVGTTPTGGQRLVRVPAVRVTDLVKELGWQPLDFVKMDLEGWEPRALIGMSALLTADDAPAVLYESNGHTLGLYGATPNDLLTVFEESGYTSYLVDALRLVETHPGDIQPQTIVDYLAVKKPPSRRLSYELEGPMTPGERITRILADASHPNPDHRAYMASALCEAGTDVLARDDIRDILEALSNDETESVRAAVAWWPPTMAHS